MNRRFVALMAILTWGIAGVAAERSILPMGNALLTSLGDAQKMLNAGEIDAAIELASDIAVDGFNGTERGQLANFLGIALFQRGDRSAAVDAFKEVIGHASHVPASVEYNARFNVAQLYFLKRQYDRAIDAMDALRATDAPVSPQQIYFLGQVHYRAENYGPAADTIAEAIAAIADSGAAPPEEWTTLQRHAELRR